MNGTRVGGPVLTLRSVLVGVGVGTVMCCSNTYFGLQSGWVTAGSIQSALLGFGIFKALQKCGLGDKFSVGENVIIQTISVAISTMPVTAGLVSVIPALSMLTEDDNPPQGSFTISVTKLILWTLSVAFFGNFAALPLRQQTVVKEQLKFPSGTATAEVIHILHQQDETVYHRVSSLDSRHDSGEIIAAAEEGTGTEMVTFTTTVHPSEGDDVEVAEIDTNSAISSSSWVHSLHVLLISVVVAFVYKILAELVVVREEQILAVFPLFSWLGWETATQWGWVLYPAPGYIGQGMIMGSRTCISMIAGSFFGFAFLGPIAKSQGWAPGAIDNKENGPAGWVLWIALAVMLGDSLTSLVLLTLRTLYRTRREAKREQSASLVERDFPSRWWISGIGFSTVLCTLIVSPMFSMPLYQPAIAVVLAALIAVLAVRALGETDLNPASGIGKISQIVFSFVAAGKVVPNIIAGAIAEAGAIQAGDMMQDFKTAYILGIPPTPQFYAQMIGSFVSCFVSVGVYSLYTTAWEIPSKELPVPSASIWIDMARLFNGGSLPEKVWIFALVFALASVTLVIMAQLQSTRQNKARWTLPSGLGFAVGMYLGPKHVIPRLIGSLLHSIWRHKSERTHSSFMIVLASGLVLGEGIGAIIIAFRHAFTSIA